MFRTACDGFFNAAPLGRREFLRAGALPLVGLGLPELLRGKLSLARELWQRKGVLAPMQQALAEATARCSA